MKKRVLILALTSLLCLNLMAMPAFAAEAPENPVSAETNTEVVSPMAEETEWVYRINDGVWQKRLWSLTYAVWLTDWIDCVV